MRSYFVGPVNHADPGISDNWLAFQRQELQACLLRYGSDCSVNVIWCITI